MFKKMFCLLMALLMFASCALAEDTGIVIIGEPESEEEPVNMDDFKPGNTASIDGYADVTLVSCEFTDRIDSEYRYFDPGEGAKYLQLRLKLLNTQHKPYNFLPEISNIICDFGDGYQYAGWLRQERSYNDGRWVPYDTADKSDEIGVLYTGYFDIVVTLPDYVVESKEPLSVSFNVGKSEFTVHYRR